MNSMLYIIVGLVVIVLIAVVVLRKKKGQQPPSQMTKPADKNLANNRSVAAVNKESPVSNPYSSPKDTHKASQQHATQFDPVTVAQRFMDQQRYDKAIETLERGLIEEPQNTQLLLKLLNIYAINNQFDDFNKTYNLIKSFDDSAGIGEADQLKALLEQEQTQNQVVEPETNVDSAFETLDFDLSTSSSATKTPSTSSIDNVDELPAQSATMSVQQQGSDDSFDLILEDLGATESNANKDNDFNIATETSFDETRAEPVVSEEPKATRNINVDDDFTLDFDLMSADSSSAELNVVDDAQVQDGQAQEIVSDDDFALELDNLVTETNRTEALENSLDIDSEDFALLLENADNIAIEDSINDNASSTFDIDVEDTPAQIETLSTKGASSANDATQPTFSEVSDTDISLFDDADATDNTAFDNIAFDDAIADDSTSVNEFDLESNAASPTATMPVESESTANLFEDDVADNKDDNSNAATPVDPTFAAQFAKDFDFVNTLDSSQVTLDLAGQYLQLGEYDSAKRLLNEVITQGNSTQQNQAQEMLARTA